MRTLVQVWLVFAIIAILGCGTKQTHETHYLYASTQVLGYERNNLSPYYNQIVAGFQFNQTRKYVDNKWVQTTTTLTVINVTNKTLTFGYRVNAWATNHSDSVVALAPGQSYYVGVVSDNMIQLEEDSVAVTIETPIIYGIAN